jgi:hypothetical protein
MHLLDALGTRSQEFSHVFLGQIEWVCRQPGEKSLSETSLNAALAVVDGIEAENEVEAMLGAQMAGTHAVAMELLARARHSEDVLRSIAYGNLAARLLRTYTTQLEALAKLRRRGAQTVRVEHVHVHEGAQAIVGHVHPSGPATGERKNEEPREPEARHCAEAAVEHAAGAPVWGQDQGRESMPVPNREGAEEMSHARRRARQRRS